MPALTRNQLRRPWRRLWPLLLLLVLTLGEYRLLRRLLFEDRAEIAFVQANVTGILTGTPVWKSSQHRVLTPLAVAALEPLAGSHSKALAWFMGLGILAENLLLWRLLRSRGAGAALALSGVFAFGLAHVLTLYKLEYPWDSVDIVLFTAFGFWASTGGKLLALVPLVIVGTVNHETVLYLPLWCALAACDRSLTERRRKSEWLAAGALFVGAAAGIFLLRELLYVGPASLPGHAPEAATPWLENPIHLRHNLRQFLWLNWSAGRAWVSISVLTALLSCAGLILARRHTRAALWSVAVLATIFCFGYVNETRLYLVLIAFWFGYAAARVRV